MLTRLTVKNFRLLRDVTIDVEPGKPIVLIGPNGSGKSSVIQVLDLLGRAATDGLKEALQGFGGAAALVSASAPTAIMPEALVEVALGTEEVPSPDVVDYSLNLSRSGVVHESLRLLPDDGSGRELMSRDTAKLVYNGLEKVVQDLSYTASEMLSFELDKRMFPAVWQLGHVRSALSTVKIYDGFLTTPLWAKDLREGRLSPFDSTMAEPCPRIDRRGLDLINALYYLQSSHPDEWEELQRSFKAEFPFVTRLEFPADPAGGRFALGWRDRRSPGVRLHGHQMSEGMATYLCLLAAILSPDPTTAIAFDEPERNLHPSALRRVVHLLERLSERTAVFVATHSDRFLDYLSDPAGSLRVCEPSEDGVSIQKLDREVLDAWRAKFTLSELRQRGQIDPSNSSAVEP